MSIKHSLLGLLLEGPLHGYGLKAAYEKELVPGATLNIGQVYQALDKLEAEGFVTVEVVPQAERPDRKVYTLTASGLEDLKRWLTSPSERGLELRNETFLKLLLAWRLRTRLGIDPVQILDSERRACLAHLHEWTAARERADQEGASLSTMLLLELTIQRLAAFHQWLERVEEMTRAGEKS